MRIRIAESRKHLLLFIHGGGWVGGSVDEALQHNMKGVLTQNGFDLAFLDYTKATPIAPSYPEVIREVQRAINTLRRKYRPLSVTLVATSAGTTISLMSTITYSNLKHKHVPADNLALFYGFYDFDHTEDLNPAALMGFQTFIPRKRRERANPIHRLQRLNNIPFFLRHGTSDETVFPTQTTRLINGLRDVGNLSVNYHFPVGKPHAFEIVDYLDEVQYFVLQQHRQREKKHVHLSAA